MQKNKFRIVHAADLHLGAPFKGLSASINAGTGPGALPFGLRETLVQATYDALENLVALCLEIKPHALLLAGDLYNPEGGGLKSLNALKGACQRLEAANIMVLMIHGNHDAANLQPNWSWPENVHVFRPDQAESIPVLLANGQLMLGNPIEQNSPLHPSENTGCLAIIHGISHLQEKVTDNLAVVVGEHIRKIESLSPSVSSAEGVDAPEPGPHPALAGGIWKIGLLHCAVGEKASEGEKPYAPCSIDDLAQANVDYWALGHIHKRGMVSQSPLAWYSGNSQGMHINETGPKGCLVVDFNPGLEPDVQFHSLACVEWHQLEYNLSPEMSLSQVQEALLALATKLHAQRLEANLKGLILRLRITGRSMLDGWLRGQNGQSNEFESQLQSALGGLSPFIWLKDIVIDTRPAIDLDKALADPGLLGETLGRILDARKHLEHSPEVRDELIAANNSPLGELYNSPALRQAGIAAPDNAELAAMLEEAAWLCADLLNAEAAPALQGPQPESDPEAGSGE